MTIAFKQLIQEFFRIQTPRVISVLSSNFVFQSTNSWVLAEVVYVQCAATLFQNNFCAFLPFAENILRIIVCSFC
jgi:hypothetical protein